MDYNHNGKIDKEDCVILQLIGNGCVYGGKGFTNDEAFGPPGKEEARGTILSYQQEVWKGWQ